MLKSTLSLALLLVVGACATQPKAVAPKPEIRSIAIVPATNPTSFTLLHLSNLAFLIPLSQTLDYMDSKEKAKLLNERLFAKPSTLAADLTEEVAEGLRLRGYRIEIVENVTRPPNDVDDVDLEKVSTTADAILQLRFTEVGLFSPRSSADYLPRVNAHGTLVVKKLDDGLYDEDVQYGVDAKVGKAWAIEADKAFAYPNFNSVMANIEVIRGVFTTGAHEIGKRMAEQVSASLK